MDYNTSVLIVLLAVSNQEAVIDMVARLCQATPGTQIWVARAIIAEILAMVCGQFGTYRFLVPFLIRSAIHPIVWQAQ